MVTYTMGRGRSDLVFPVGQAGGGRGRQKCSVMIGQLEYVVEGVGVCAGGAVCRMIKLFCIAPPHSPPRPASTALQQKLKRSCAILEHK